MKQTLAAVVVIVVVAAIGFAGFWIGRTGAPPLLTRNEIAIAPAVAQSTSSLSDPAASPTTPVLKNAARSIRNQVVNASTPPTQVTQRADAPTKNPDRPSRSTKAHGYQFRHADKDASGGHFPFYR